MSFGFMGAIAHSAGAQDARLRHRLDAATLAAVSAVIDSARAEKLPTEPLVQRALQGNLKGVPGPAIAAAVRELASELRTTRKTLGPLSSAELTAGAAALHSGATLAELKMLRATRPHGSLTIPFGTLADLVSHGVEASKASEVIRVALANGATDAELLALRRNVEKDIHAGASPSDAAGVRVKGVQPKRKSK